MKRKATVELDIKNPATTCRARRKAKKLSQADLAHASGVSVGVILRLEWAESVDDLGNMYVTSILAVAAALGITACRLVPALRE